MDNNPVTYMFEDIPEHGTVKQVTEGVYWIRMPLPFQLNHINLWLLEDGDGWTIVDTGFANDIVRGHWETLFETVLKQRPIKKVVVTHFHPDHMGLAGWLTRRFDVEMYATLGEFAFGTAMSLYQGFDEQAHVFTDFYGKAGFTPEQMEMVKHRGNPYTRRVMPLPQSYRRIFDGDLVDINGYGWRIIVGTGHSPEHACLYCEERKLLISGDQILPRISPNVSVWPQEPQANPLQLFLDSLRRFQGLADDTLVLPSHDTPFTGLKGRLDQLAHHHDDRLEETFEVCQTPSTGYQMLKALFTRELDEHQTFFALGESLAHLHFLMGQGRVKRELNEEGVYVFSQA